MKGVYLPQIHVAPNKKPRKRWVPDLSQGYTPDLLTDVWKPVSQAAEQLELSMIHLVGEKATEPTPNKPAFITVLSDLVYYGLGVVAKKAETTLSVSQKIGEEATRRRLEKLFHQRGSRPKKLPAHAKPPRSEKLGVTLQAPKEIHGIIQQLAPTLIGSGSHLFDDVVHAIAKNPPGSDAARRRVAQEILDGFKDKGITGFVDKGGKRWNLTSYVEMATRKAAGDLAFAAAVENLIKHDVDTVRVTVMPNCHPLCQPFQGRLLSITGITKKVGAEPVVSTLEEAIARGFRHIGCRHTVYPWGLGDPITQPDSIDPGDYAASQKLREAERMVRKWKRAKAAAVTPEATQQANKKIRHYQARIRQIVEETGVPRNRFREQITHAL